MHHACHVNHGSEEKTDKDENNCRKRRVGLKNLDEWTHSTIFGMNLTNSTCILR
jgi:hypothetical protein